MRYAIVQIGESRVAVSIDAFVEILPLPRLLPAPGAPGYIVGLADVRGSLLPVADLAVRFGGRPSTVSAESALLWLRLDHFDIGVLVDGASEFVDADALPAPSFDPTSRPLEPYLTSVVRTHETLASVLDFERLLAHDADALAGLVALTDAAPDDLDERLTRRARDLAADRIDSGASGTAYIVCGVDEHRIGIPASSVLGLATLSRFEPLPGAPAWVIGVSRVRGRTLVVVDPRSILGLPVAARTLPQFACILGRDNDAVALAVDSLVLVDDVDTTAALGPPGEIDAGLVERVHFTSGGPIVLVAPEHLLNRIFANEGASPG